MKLRILLSKDKPKLAYVLAENDTDQKCLRVLFNANLIRGAYSFWNGEGGMPMQYEPFNRLTEFQITAVLAIGTQNPIEDITKKEKVSQFKEEMETKIKTEEKAKEIVKQTENFEFLNNDATFFKEEANEE